MCVTVCTVGTCASPGTGKKNREELSFFPLVSISSRVFDLGEGRKEIQRTFSSGERKKGEKYDTRRETRGENMKDNESLMGFSLFTLQCGSLKRGLTT